LTSYLSTQNKDYCSVLSGEVAVDVVVIPAEFKPGTWTLSDRLGRPLRTIAEVSPALFVINAAPNSGLSGMASASFLALHDAMTAIARHMKGECQLSSSDEKRG
jgi:hypothetical protein